MRILLTHHRPLRQSPSGWLVWQWGQALAEAGNEVRLLVTDSEHRSGEPLVVDRVVCGDAAGSDLRFGLPRFHAEGDATGTQLFTDLSDSELTQYRDVLRRRLDHQIMHFDPHVVHAQHVWLFGQLALESGVPYVLSAWNEELDDCAVDPRYRMLAEQTAENASRILTPDEATRERVAQLFELAAERTVVMPAEWDLSAPDVSEAARAATAAGLCDLYQTVLKERFG